MLIHKAWYGPKGGHALLASTELTLQALFRQAAWLTDLPGTLPAGLQWRPYFRTAIHENFFVLVHTRPSADATRAGMVDSVAAFVPLSGLPLVPSMRRLAADLAQTHDSIERLPFDTLSVDAGEPPVSSSQLLIRVANALVWAKQRPVVHVGQEQFDDGMLALLDLVPESLRKDILFGISFSPEDVGDAIAVAVPAQLSSRFPFTSMLGTVDQAPSAAAAALLRFEHGQELLKFAKDGSFSFESLKSLVLLEEAFRLWNSAPTVADAINLVRVLATITGDGHSASEIRQSTLNKLTAKAADWTAADVLFMRNLDLSRYQDGSFRTAVKDWTAQQCMRKTQSDDDSRLLEQSARNAAKQTWWNADTQTGFATALKNNSEYVCALAWQTLLASPDSLQHLLGFFAAQDALPALARNVPSTLPSPTGYAVSQEAATRGAWPLCAAALAASKAPYDALKAVLKLGPPKANRTAAIQGALVKTTPNELVDIAVREDLPEVTALAAKAVEHDTKLMRTFVWHSPVWFDILASVATSNPAAVAQVPDKLKGLESVIAHDEQSERVWSALVKAHLADLAAVSNRPLAWTLVPGPLRSDVARQTAEGWLSGVQAGTLNVAPLEEPLRSEVRNRLRTSDLAVSIAKKFPRQFIDILESIYPQTDSECLELLEAYGRASQNQLDAVVAIAVGARIREQSWTQSAARAGSFAVWRDDFLPLCGECLSLMSFLVRVQLSWRIGKRVEVSPDEVWRVLEEELAKLYPLGPRDQELWSRSGGKDEVLRVEGNGLTQWHRCIKQVRAGGAPSGATLLREALRDFGGNSVLQGLQDSHALD